jgi:hypothetical protein
LLVSIGTCETADFQRYLADSTAKVLSMKNNFAIPDSELPSLTAAIKARRLELDWIGFMHQKNLNFYALFY